MRAWRNQLAEVCDGLRPELLHDVAGALEGLVQVVWAGQKEKVVRVGLLALKQLLQDPSLGYDTTLVDAGLLKLVTTRSLQARDPLTVTLNQESLIHALGSMMMSTGGPDGLKMLRRACCGMGWIYSTQHSACKSPAHAAVHATKQMHSFCCTGGVRR